MLRSNKNRIRKEFVEHSQEWHGQRYNVIGGTDASAILNMHDYITMPLCYMTKIGERTVKVDNRFTFAGQNAEPNIVKFFCYWDHENPDTETMISNYRKKDKLRQVYHNTASFVLRDFPWIGGNPDGFYTEKGKGLGILESKARSRWMIESYVDKIVPSDYIQLQHYLLVCGLKHGTLGYLIDGVEYRYYRFDADYKLHEKLLEEYAEFWKLVKKARAIKQRSGINQYVQIHPDNFKHEQLDDLAELQRIEPDFVGHKAELEWVKEKFEEVNKEEDDKMEGTTEQWDRMMTYSDINAQMKDLQQKKDLEASELIASLNGHNKAEFDDGSYFSYKNRITVKIR